MPTNFEVLNRWLEILAKGDIFAWPDVVADHVVIEFPFLHGAACILDGIDAARRTIGQFWKIFASFEWEDVETRATDDPALLLTTARSKARTVSGQDYANRYVLLVRIEQGKVVRHTEYFDPVLSSELIASVPT